MHLSEFTPSNWSNFLPYLTNTELFFPMGFKIPENPIYVSTFPKIDNYQITTDAEVKFGKF